MNFKRVIVGILLITLVFNFTYQINEADANPGAALYYVLAGLLTAGGIAVETGAWTDFQKVVDRWWDSQTLSEQNYWTERAEQARKVGYFVVTDNDWDKVMDYIKDTYPNADNYLVDEVVYQNGFQGASRASAGELIVGEMKGTYGEYRYISIWKWSTGSPSYHQVGYYYLSGGSWIIQANSIATKEDTNVSWDIVNGYLYFYYTNENGIASQKSFYPGTGYYVTQTRDIGAVFNYNPGEWYENSAAPDGTVPDRRFEVPENVNEMTAAEIFAYMQELGFEGLRDNINAYIEGTTTWQGDVENSIDENTTSVVGALSLIWDLLKSGFGSLAQALRNLLDKTAEIANALNPAQDTFFLRVALVPDIAVLQGFADSINNNLNNKFQFLDIYQEIQDQANSDTNNQFQDIYVNLPVFGNQKIVEADYVNTAGAYFKNILIAFVGFLTVIFTFKRWANIGSV